MLACSAGPYRPSLTPPGDERSESGDGRQGATKAGPADGFPEACVAEPTRAITVWIICAFVVGPGGDGNVP